MDFSDQSKPLEFRDEIEQFRRNNNLTLEDLAEITGVSKATLGRIEQGIANPRPDTIIKIRSSIDEYIVERLLKGLDVGFDYYSPSDVREILEFNKYFLEKSECALVVKDSSIEVLRRFDEDIYFGYRVTLQELESIMNDVMQSYHSVLNRRLPFPKRL